MDFFTINGIQEVTDEYRKKLAAYKACEAAGIEIPEEIWKFFNHETPLEHGFLTNLNHAGEEVGAHDAYAVIVDLDKVPSGIRKLLVSCAT